MKKSLIALFLLSLFLISACTQRQGSTTILQQRQIIIQNVSSGNTSVNVTLNQVLDPTADKVFTLGNKNLEWQITTGSFLIEALGAFTTDLLHVHQHTGNPSPGAHLAHFEAEDPDVLGLNITVGGNTAIYTNKDIVARLFYGNLSCSNITGSSSNLCTITSSGFSGSSSYYNLTNSTGGLRLQITTDEDNVTINFKGTRLNFLDNSDTSCYIDQTDTLNCQKMNITNPTGLYGNGSQLVSLDGTKMTIGVTGSANVVKSTSPTITTPTLTRPTASNITMTINSYIRLNATSSIGGVTCTTATEGAVTYNATLRRHIGCNSTHWVALY